MKWKDAFKSSLALGLPLLVNDLFRYLLYFVDIAMVGHLSAHAMTVAGLAGLSNAILINVLFGLSAGTQGVFAQKIGGGAPEERLHSLHRLFRAVAFAAGLLFFILYWFAAPLLIGFTASGVPSGAEAFRSDALAYSRAIGLSLLVMSVFFVDHGYLAARGKTRIIMWSGLLMASLNVIANYVLIYIFKYGVVGAAFGTVFAQLAGAFFIARFTPSLGAILFERREIERLARFALWPGLQAGLALISIFAFQSLCGWNGKEALAATILALTVHRVLKVIVAGFANGSSILIGFELARSNRGAARALLLTALATGALLIAAALALILAFDRALIALFGPELAGSRLARSAVWFFAPLMALDALAAVSSTVLGKNGAGRLPFWSELATHAVFTIGLGYALWAGTPLKIYGIWSAFALQIVFNFLFIQTYALRGPWMQRI